MKAAAVGVLLAGAALALATLFVPTSRALSRAELVERLGRAEARAAAEEYAAAESVLTEIAPLLSLDDAELAARAELVRAELAGERGERGAEQRAFAAARVAVERAGEPLLEARLARAEAQAAWRRAEYAYAEERASWAAARAHAAGESAEEGRAVELGARSLFKRGRYDEADAHFESARDLCADAGDVGCAARAELGLALSSLDRRRFAAAAPRFDAAAAGFARAGDAFGESEALALAGAVDLFAEIPEQARERALGALAVAARAGEHGAEARARQVLGHAERMRGRPEEALVQLRRSAALRRANGNPREEAWARAGISRSLVALGRPDEARRALERSLVVWRALEDRRALAWHLLEAARLDVELGLTARADLELDEAASLAVAIELPYASEIFDERARRLAARGELGAAAAEAERAVAAARAAANDEMLWAAAIELARQRAATGRRAEAAAAIAEALGALERLRTVEPGGEEARIAAVDRTRRAYDTAIGLLFDAGRGDEALLVAESARARALLDRCGARPAATLDEIRATARRHRIAILVAFSGVQRLYLWAVSAEGRIAAHSVALRSTELAALVERALTETTASSDSAWPELARHVWQPLADALAPARGPLAIAADGALQRLPFGALPIDAVERLIDRRALVTIPSIGFLAAGRAPRSGSERVVLLADPEPPPVPGRDLPLPRLPGARREAAAVARLFPAERVTLLVGRDASEERLASAAPGARILHLAAHGLTDVHRPLASRLALAASAHADGLWSAREALALPLNAELVVLSACGSGTGVDAGEGVLGFGQALLGAGARSVLVTLWSLADVVAERELELFYRRLAAGDDRAAALRAAALGVRSALTDGRLRSSSGERLAPEPRLWAAFVLLGDPG